MTRKAKTRLTKVIKFSFASRGDSTTIDSNNPSIASHLAENDWGVGWKMHSRPHEQVCLEGDGVWRPRGGLAYLPCTRIQGEEEAFSIRRCLNLWSFQTSRPWNQVRLFFFVNNHQKCGLKGPHGVWFGTRLSSGWRVYSLLLWGQRRVFLVINSSMHGLWICWYGHVYGLRIPDI